MPFPTPKTSLAPVEHVLMESISAQAIIDAVRMNLFDHLSSQPMPAAVLAKAMELKTEPLEAMLDVLVDRHLLTLDGKIYANTEMTEEYLVSASPLYQGKALSLQHGHNELLRKSLPTLLKGGTMEREKTDESWAEADTMDGTLQHALNGQLQMAVAYLKELPEFASFRTMADIGGNHGHYSMELLEHNPDLTSAILDLPNVTAPAMQRCTALGYGDRITCEPFDLRSDELPEEAYDFVFTSHILYGCVDDLENVFRNIHRSLKAGGCFASHHLSREGGASRLYQTSVELITRLMGYKTHFLSGRDLEEPLTAAGFGNFTHTFTGCDGQTLLLVARKL
ncbi:MAG: methyltransferase [Pseudodesulfovibrio sp.]|uniref:O-methyltransferase family 2 n=1 Tax=Pseudodesulfovibrio aespoeensis (strain ATCC 700646 / DSM 10631 / Aspo-2) TaxID=643562 RepID=E6VTL7_PSEA9|nr:MULTISPECIES: methyltransferase dimerization domain-containing protein [Pseudodesulfovibrio]MBU4243410.1 methyltransferase [Pseudomonadota bacterium]ADU63304.1 O-methyltransferase family 2 [Pseudodesulfovibrio aespoeensis Aspo-2]MBU4378139.1 methyltransferase [Pseudomonadota bacterium]MBU4474958.1 methyltransferase [Pseudomonadota bacterium]MBU4516125.1 methyltransferase [Pseudomonadota bacterium]